MLVTDSLKQAASPTAPPPTPPEDKSKASVARDLFGSPSPPSTPAAAGEVKVAVRGADAGGGSAAASPFSSSNAADSLSEGQRSLADEIMGLVSRTKQASEFTVDRKTARPVTLEELQSKLQSEADKYMSASTCNSEGHEYKSFFLNSLDVYMEASYYDKLQQPANAALLASTEEAAVSLFALLGRLAGDVFEMSTDGWDIFVSDCKVIAFNRARHLFFNAHYHRSLLASARSRIASGRLAEGDMQRELASFWFTTFCHELAHNVASGHDKEHEWAMETLICAFLPRLAKLMAKL